MRVKKIINADDDVSHCSANAAFAITFATEQFVYYMVEQVHNVVKAERKPRRNIQYKDVANAVARVDNLEFLSDVVPRTILYKTLKDREGKEKKMRDREDRERQAQSIVRPEDGDDGDDAERRESVGSQVTEDDVDGEPRELAIRRAGLDGGERSSSHTRDASGDQTMSKVNGVHPSTDSRDIEMSQD